MENDKMLCHCGRWINKNNTTHFKTKLHIELMKRLAELKHTPLWLYL